MDSNTYKNANSGFSSIRNQQLTELLENRVEFFNFFVYNNGIFKFISEEDETRLLVENKLFEIRNTAYSILALGTVFTVDQILFRIFKPNFRIAKFRFPIFLGKYIMIPIATAFASYQLGIGELEKTYNEIDEKYNFGMTEYNLAMDILERAFDAGKLEDLLEQKGNFNWNEVTEMETYRKNNPISEF